MRLRVFNDRSILQDLPDEVLAVLDRYKLVKQGRFAKIHFCGVIVVGEQAFSFLPRGVNDFNTFGATALLLNILDRYNIAAETALTGGTISDDTEGLGLLSNIIWLLRDYVANGLYSTAGKKRQRNVGKINWNRTISRETPVEGVGGSPIYPTLHTERLTYASLSPVTLIHADIIKEIDEHFGWVLTGDPEVKVAVDLAGVPISPLRGLDRLYALRLALNGSYSDRHIRLLNILIDFIDQRYDGGAGEYLIGTRTFQTVWEEMLRRTLPGVVEVNSKLPKPAVYLKDNGKPQLAKGMVTDIVASYGNVVSVIDAKYYQGESADDSPGWADLVKQFFYSKALGRVFPGREIASWFVLPRQTTIINKGPISHFTVVDAKTGEPLPDDFPPIGCAYLCPIDVMQRYASSRKYSFTEVSPLFLKNYYD